MMPPMIETPPKNAAIKRLVHGLMRPLRTFQPAFTKRAAPLRTHANAEWGKSRPRNDIKGLVILTGRRPVLPFSTGTQTNAAAATSVSLLKIFPVRAGLVLAFSSSRNLAMKLSVGHEQASPKAQMVLPSI